MKNTNQRGGELIYTTVSGKIFAGVCKGKESFLVLKDTLAKSILKCDFSAFSKFGSNIKLLADNFWEGILGML